MTTQTNKIRISRKQLEAMDQEQLFKFTNELQRLSAANANKRLDYYLENAHDAQMQFHKAPHRWRAFLAGNRVGKSLAGTVELIWRCLGIHPFQKCSVPIKCCVIAQDFENHVKNILEPKLLEWAPPGSIKKIERHQSGALKRVFWTTGSIIDYYSHDQDIKVFEGSDYDVAWADEPPPKKIHDAVWRGLTDRGGVLFITGTPLTEPWLYQEWQKSQNDPDGIRWSIFVDSYINAKNLGQGDEALGRKRVDEMAAMYDEDEREARINGKFIQLRGLVFKSWDRKLHLLDPFEWPREWPIIETIDPHPRKPWAIGWIGLAPNGARILLKSSKIEGVVDEVASEMILCRQNLNIELNVRPRLTRCIIDNYASAPLMSRSNTDPTARRVSIREELNNLIGPPGAGGPTLEVAPKNISQKIETLKGWLAIKEWPDGSKRPTFYVFDNAENQIFVDEIENYIWDTYRGRIRTGFKDTPKKTNDDILDAVMQVGLTLGAETGQEYGVFNMTQRGGGHGTERSRFFATI